MRIGICLLLVLVVPLAIVSRAAGDEPSGVLRLKQVIDAALESNPELNVSAASISIKDAQALQAGLRPNPTAGLNMEDIAGSGDRSGWQSGETTLSLSQLIELGSKREKRLRSAELERDVAMGDYLARRRGVIAESTASFASVLVAQERLALAEELVQLSGGAVDTVAATVKSGSVSPIEQHRASATLARAQAERTAAERELIRARIALAATWGSTAPAFTKVEGKIEPLLPPAPLATLLEQADASPEVARLDVEVAQRRAAMDVENSKVIPSVTLGAGVRQYADQSDVGLVIGIQVPLPLFDRNQGNILAASRDITRTELERVAARNRGRTEVSRAHEVQRSSLIQAVTLRDRGIPAARRAYDGAKDAYQKGLFRYLEVLDAQRTMFELRAAYLDAVDLYYQASSDLVRWAAISADEKSNAKE